MSADPDNQAGVPEWGRMLTLPNLFTFLRALLVPVILILLFQRDDVSRWWAFGIFSFAAWTDSVDGWVARRYSGVTRWGQLADPIADKLLIGGSLISLALVGDLPWVAVIIIVAREVGVTGLRLTLIRRHGFVMPASSWGKLKTVAQITAVAAYLIPPFPAALASVLLWAAVALTLWSGVEYAVQAARLARAADGTPVDPAASP